MEEIQNILDEYKSIDISKEISTLGRMKDFSTKFYGDVANIYDAITRIKNIERNPTGYNFNDAAILGLLIRIWKIFKEVVYYYKEDKGEIIAHLDRLILESAVIAHYLLINDEDVTVDYRKCSYKDRLNIIVDSNRSPEFFKTPAGIRLKSSILNKMNAEGWSVDSFEEQKRNRWKLSGKNFYEIFREIVPQNLYKYLYGIPSEAIHGSWNESMDFHLQRNQDGTFSPYPHYQPVDMRFITPLLRITNEPYLLWLKRIDADLEYFEKIFQWISSVNYKLFDSFEKVYAEEINEN
ncbi:MAG: hypothetical protein H8E80_08925 [Desulfobacteraceae bacterium]|uniref:Uncharacterized protein n=1 Tax=Candidatus Desulfaltia bathyphila TaxID=2841697 RepID=A0A8J6TCA5_9BACT|nr:hypothetical protein [Candidatus Desulfaltia bathyphila]